MKGHKRFFSILVMGLFIVSTAFAASSPVNMMQGVANRLLSALEKNKAHLNQFSVINRIVDKNLVPAVDVNRMSAAVVGRRYWMKATPAQKKEFVKQFKQLVVATYADAFSSYDGDTVKFYPLRGGVGKKRVVTVNSVLVRRSGQKIPISYNMIRRGNSWKVYDFSIENISMVNSYQSQFAGVLARGGMPALLRQLVIHNKRRQG